MSAIASQKAADEIAQMNGAEMQSEHQAKVEKVELVEKIEEQSEVDQNQVSQTDEITGKHDRLLFFTQSMNSIFNGY